MFNFSTNIYISSCFACCCFFACYTLKVWYVHDLQSKSTSQKCRSTAKVQICINLDYNEASVLIHDAVYYSCNVDPFTYHTSNIMMSLLDVFVWVCMHLHYDLITHLLRDSSTGYQNDITFFCVREA